MQSPWQLFGIDPTTATERDLKLAYARMIKIHRPDEDPAGFKLVREAYEIGLDVLRHPKAATVATSTPQKVVAVEVAPPVVTADPPVIYVPIALPQAMPSPIVPYLDVEEREVEPSPSEVPEDPAIGYTPSEAPPIEPPPAAAEPPPPALVDAENAVARVVESADHSAISRSIASLFYLCRTIEPGAAGIRLWHQSLHRSTRGNSALVAAGVTLPQFIIELESGASLITHACIGHWEAVGDMRAMSELAEAILGERDRLHAEEAAIVALRLSLEGGFVFPSVATRLLNFAFPHLDREARDSYLALAENQIRQGAAFRGFRKDQHSYWHRRVRHPQVDWSWEDNTAEAAIEYLAATRRQDWEGYAIVRRIAPAAWFTRLETAVQRVRTAKESAEAKAASLGMLEHTKRSKPSGESRLLWIVAWLCALCAVGYFAWEQPKFRQSFESLLQAIWSKPKPVVPAPTPTAKLQRPKVRGPAPDYSTGHKRCLTRLAQIQQEWPGIKVYTSLLNDMHSSNVIFLGKQDETAKSKAALFVASVQQTFRDLSSSESPQREQWLLEYLVVDVAIPLEIKQQAMLRQRQSQLREHWLSIWELAARDSKSQSDVVAEMAESVLSDDSIMSPAEKANLQMLIDEWTE
jgi:hypothetical protein